MNPYIVRVRKWLQRDCTDEGLQHHTMVLTSIRPFETVQLSQWDDASYLLALYQRMPLCHRIAVNRLIAQFSAERK